MQIDNSDVQFENSVNWQSVNSSVEESDIMRSDPAFGVDPVTSSSVKPPKDVPIYTDTSQRSVVSSMSVCRVCVQDVKGQDMVPLVSEVKVDKSGVAILDMINAVSRVEAKTNDGLPTGVCVPCLKRIITAYRLKNQCESSNVTLRKLLEKLNHQKEEQRNKEINRSSIASSSKPSRKVFCRECNIAMLKSEVPMHMATCKMKIQAENLTANQKKVLASKEEQRNKEINRSSIASSSKPSRKVFCRECNIAMLKSEVPMHMATCKMKIQAENLTANQKKVLACCSCNCLLFFVDIEEHRKVCNKLKLHERITENLLSNDYTGQSSDEEYSQKDLDNYTKRKARQCEPQAKIRPYSCSHCEETFDLYVGMRAHIKQVHPTSPERLCTICGKMVKRKVWKLHQNRHAKFKPHTCELCNKKFYLLDRLRIHFRTHTKEKPYQCTLCPNRYNQKISLKYHMRAHLGEKPYACIICNRSFITPQNMRLHMKVHEVINDEDRCDATAKANTSVRKKVKKKEGDI